MDLKMWNRVQMTAFRECSVDITDAVEVYRFASLISHIRNERDYDVALRRVIDIIDREATL